MVIILHFCSVKHVLIKEVHALACALAPLHQCVCDWCLWACTFERTCACWGKWANLSVYPDHVHARCRCCCNEEHIWTDITSTCCGDRRGAFRKHTVLIEHTLGLTLVFFHLNQFYSTFNIKNVMVVIVGLQQQYNKKKTSIYSIIHIKK